MTKSWYAMSTLCIDSTWLRCKLAISLSVPALLNLRKSHGLAQVVRQSRTTSPPACNDTGLPLRTLICSSVYFPLLFFFIINNTSPSSLCTLFVITVMHHDLVSSHLISTLLILSSKLILIITSCFSSHQSRLASSSPRHHSFSNIFHHHRQSSTSSWAVSSHLIMVCKVSS